MQPGWSNSVLTRRATGPLRIRSNRNDPTMKTSTHQKSTHIVGLVAAALLCGLPAVSQAQDAAPPPETETVNQPTDNKSTANLGAKFTGFAGSEENAKALITGLQGGTTVTLTSTVNGQATTTEFQPATSEMGQGNAALSLALAQESLNKIGITEPSPDQIVAALNGGSVTGSDGTATTLAGVLTLRAAGQGWGDIAKTLGVKVGPLMRDLHAAHPRMDRPERPEHPAHVAKPERVDRPAHVPVRPEPVHRPASAGPQRMPVLPPAPTRHGKP